MIIRLVSFNKYERLTEKQRVIRKNAITNVLNNYDSDFVMFSGKLFTSKEHLYETLHLVKNKKVSALFELTISGENHLFLLQNGVLNNLNTYQIFCRAEKASKKNIERLIEELEQHRQFVVHDKRFLVIQCGENMILRNQSNEKPVFRLQDRDLKRRFDRIINGVNVILNPTHSRWSRFGQLTDRIAKFSEKQRYCFYCTRLEGNMLKDAVNEPKVNTSQRAMSNGQILAPFDHTGEDNKDYLMLSYKI